MTTSHQIIARLRRKVEIVRLDQKARNSSVYYDMDEMLTLIDMLQRALPKEGTDADV